VRRRWRPVFWGPQLKKGCLLFSGKKCIRVTCLEDFLTSKWPGSFTVLAPPLLNCHERNWGHFILCYRKGRSIIIIIIIIIIILLILVILILNRTYMVLSSWQTHCESLPGSFDECRTAPSGCRPSDQATRLRLWVYLYAAIIYTHHRHLVLLSAKDAFLSAHGR